jgi:hypothetical protein
VNYPQVFERVIRLAPFVYGSRSNAYTIEIRRRDVSWVASIEGGTTHVARTLDEALDALDNHVCSEAKRIADHLERSLGVP